MPLLLAEAWGRAAWGAESTPLAFIGAMIAVGALGAGIWLAVVRIGVE